MAKHFNELSPLGQCRFYVVELPASHLTTNNPNPEDETMIALYAAFFEMPPEVNSKALIDYLLSSHLILEGLMGSHEKLPTMPCLSDLITIKEELWQDQDRMVGMMEDYCVFRLALERRLHDTKKVMDSMPRKGRTQSEAFRWEMLAQRDGLWDFCTEDRNATTIQRFPHTLIPLVNKIMQSFGDRRRIERTTI